VIVVLLGLGGAVLATRYVFQEPAHITWSRYLMPEFLAQRQNYPSARWAFDLVEPLVHYPDPRVHFTASETAAPLEDAEAWSSALVGPRPAGIEGPLPTVSETILVTSAEELRAAVVSARPGSVIELQPGTYDFSGASISIDVPGEPAFPIVVRAAEPGSVRLRFSLLEGFRVAAPFWLFENLIIEGTCPTDSRCEHAFHVVGAARGVVIRNNWMINFNAAIKVNGSDGAFPDDGLILHNAFVNERPRDTDKPVAVLDFVAASGWRVQKNLIADFARARGSHISYGAFFKGAGENNLFEQNLVRCEWKHSGGARIGMSFGNGGTGRRHCRDGQCEVEHRNGVARNNIIMNCPNEVGIYLNKSAGTQLHNNALINTRGIDVRFPESSAVIANNVIDGRLLARDGGDFSETNNILSPVKAALLAKVSGDIYANPEEGDFRLIGLDSIPGRGAPLDDGGLDVCDQPYSASAPDIGPIQYRLDLACTPVIP
jgi:hypothetical protein